MTITDETIRRLRELEAEATPGPWGNSPERLWACVTSKPDGYGQVLATCAAPMDGRPDASPHADAALIVAMRNALPELLAEVEGCRKFHVDAGRWRDEQSRAERAEAAEAKADKQMEMLIEVLIEERAAHAKTVGKCVTHSADARADLEAERALADRLAEALSRLKNNLNPAAWLNVNHVLAAHAKARGR